MNIKQSFYFSLTILAVVFWLGVQPHNLNANTLEDIRKNILDRSVQIETLNKEIKQLDEQIQAVNKEGKNLEGAIKTLDISATKLDKEISVTKGKISNAGLTLQELELKIAESEKSVEKNMDAIENSLKNVQQTDDVSIIESVLTNKNLSELWNDVESMQRFQGAIKDSIVNLRDLKAELESRHKQTEATRQTLVKLSNELSDQIEVVEINKQEKSTLLSETKNKEQEYKKILDEKKRLSNAFMQELSQYENQLRLVIDPNSYPKAGKGVLAWPLDNVHITQYFGDTEFARTAAYNGKGHNGIDLRASVGTRVLAAQSGVVEGVGDTGTVRGCYSYGKWVLLRHNNGLSTFYSHLSLIKLKKGDIVGMGDVIGYSGNTGYATGPHLHFGVYATQGIRIETLSRGASRNCTGATMPIADTKAYLNPLVYL